MTNCAVCRWPRRAIPRRHRPWTRSSSRVGPARHGRASRPGLRSLRTSSHHPVHRKFRLILLGPELNCCASHMCLRDVAWSSCPLSLMRLPEHSTTADAYAMATSSPKARRSAHGPPGATSPRHRLLGTISRVPVRQARTTSVASAVFDRRWLGIESPSHRILATCSATADDHPTKDFSDLECLQQRAAVEMCQKGGAGPLVCVRKKS
jgi:hypothetical protein